MENVAQVIPYKVIDELEQVDEEVPKGVELIQAPEIWGETTGQGIKVAILDTGCDSNHPDLADRIIGGKNFSDDDDSDPTIINDYAGHGTHVSGTVAASKNDSGVTGVAPEANLLIVKVLNKDGTGQYDWIIKGIHYAIEQKVDIISMSLGGPNDQAELHEAIKKAVSNNILVVCAAGNEGDGDDSTNEMAYPGSYNEVISVGAVNFQRRSSEFSNSNNEVDLVTPGENILSTYKDGKYATLSGTSMSAPHVSGALALIKNLANKNFDRTLSEPELYAQLIRRTVPLGMSPMLEGNGLLYLTAPSYLSKIFEEELKTEVMKALK
ncbi:S8 family peptidase [Virgibacillus flavescens]|uniref:S8 family peptidase n=1 Tax=Virgibacillus flavescens TaxID=1611422 RepID=UPI003D331862